MTLIDSVWCTSKKNGAEQFNVSAMTIYSVDLMLEFIKADHTT